jgi:hypothetical protein
MRPAIAGRMWRQLSGDYGLRTIRRTQMMMHAPGASIVYLANFTEIDWLKPLFKTFSGAIDPHDDLFGQFDNL